MRSTVIVRAFRGDDKPVLALVPGCLPAALAQTQGLNDVRGYDAVDPARFVNLLLSGADPVFRRRYPMR